jgi:hypothetical protein
MTPQRQKIGQPSDPKIARLVDDRAADPHLASTAMSAARKGRVALSQAA